MVKIRSLDERSPSGTERSGVERGRSEVKDRSKRKDWRLQLQRARNLRVCRELSIVPQRPQGASMRLILDFSPNKHMRRSLVSKYLHKRTGDRICYAVAYESYVRSMTFRADPSYPSSRAGGAKG